MFFNEHRDREFIKLGSIFKIKKKNKIKAIKKDIYKHQEFLFRTKTSSPMGGSNPADSRAVPS